MPSFSKLLTSTALVFMTLASLAAADKTIEYGNLNLTLVEGTYRASDPLSTRAMTPPECDFADSRTDYSYIQITGIKGTACIGWPNFPFCGSGSWGDPDWTDIQVAMNAICAMDGAWSTSQKGSWRGTFFLFTTAFSNRDTSLFNLALASCNRSPASFFWSRDGDYATVVRNGWSCN